MITVLLVEDDTNQRALYADQLGLAGFRVLEAANFNEALKQYTSGSPDIAILDIDMPEMDGVEVMERLISKDNKLPVIFHTCYPASAESYRTSMADAYVIKSSDLSNLIKVIEEVLQKRRQLT